MAITRDSCPPAIISLARQRIAELAAAYYADDRQWFSRRFTGKSLFRSKPARFVDARQFSACYLEARTCGGSALGRWAVGETQIFPMERDIRAQAPEDPPGVMSNPAATIIFNFAFTAEGDKCVLTEIDVDGRVRRAAYSLPDGVGGEKVGATIGEEIHGNVQRGRWDTCLPEGWKSSANANTGAAS